MRIISQDRVIFQVKYGNIRNKRNNYKVHAAFFYRILKRQNNIHGEIKNCYENESRRRQFLISFKKEEEASSKNKSYKRQDREKKTHVFVGEDGEENVVEDDVGNEKPFIIMFIDRWCHSGERSVSRIVVRFWTRSFVACQNDRMGGRIFIFYKKIKRKYEKKK